MKEGEEMTYKVINRFCEKNHDGHVYEVGDIYPVEGKRLNKARADELTKAHPVYEHAFLKEIVEKPKTPKKDDEKVGDTE